MKKFILSALVTLSFGFYIIRQHIGGPETRLAAPAALQTNQKTPTQTNNQATSAATAVAPPPLAPEKITGLYKDGDYTGPVVDAYYGNVRVKATIQNNKITAVQFLQYPNERRTSQGINSEAMPYLIAEAIQAQKPNVDIISGATFTSRAFIESLGAALSKARA